MVGYSSDFYPIKIYTKNLYSLSNGKLSINIFSTISKSQSKLKISNNMPLTAKDAKKIYEEHQKKKKEGVGMTFYEDLARFKRIIEKMEEKMKIDFKEDKISSHYIKEGDYHILKKYFRSQGYDCIYSSKLIFGSDNEETTLISISIE